MGARLAPEPAGGSDLTRSQQLIWTGQELAPEAPLYNMAFAFRIDGAVSPALFRTGFAALVAGCDALCTVIESDGGVPRQRVLARLDAELELVDLSGLDDPEDAARRLVQERCETPLRLQQRLFDAALLKLAEDRYVWYFSQHHIITDAWSAQLLFQRMAEIYRRLADRDHNSPAEAPRFRSYLAYEREVRDDEPSRAYWRAHPARSLLPPRLYGEGGGRVGTASERVPFDLGPERSERLRQLAQSPPARALSLDLARFNLLATLLFAYLYRVGTRRSLAIGAPAHNRSTAAFQETVGLFVEVLPLAVEVDDDDTFLSLLGKVRVESGRFLRYATPGQSDAGLGRGFHAVLNYIRGSFPSFADAPVRAEWLHPGHGDRGHHLRLHVHDIDGSGSLRLLFDCNRDVFDAARRQAAVGHFVRLVDAMLDDVERPLARVDLLSEAERRRQLVERNATDRPEADDVVARFEAQAASSPDAIALVCGGRQLTYRALAGNADRIAAALRRRAIGPGAVCGIAMRRSAETVAAMLGALEAGAAYLPLDPDWPAERLAMVLADAAVAVVLVRADAPLEPGAGVDVVAVALDPTAAPDEPTARPPVDRDALAYLIYTSGSTGRPKGVCVERRALANYAAWAAQRYTAGAPRSFPLFTPVTFDLTVTSMFVPLVTGGTVVVYPETGRDADLALLDVVADDAVDVVKLTPSHLSLLAGRDLEASRIRLLVFGGEGLSRDTAMRARSLFPDGVRIDNEYGPTEATVGCIAHTFDPAADRGEVVPIGRPIDNMRAYVLDRHLQPLPDGVTGELYVAGAGLARGYAGADGLSRERFFTSPIDGSRLYRTGDLARFNRAGLLEYRGRGDDQVKLRGARVELGEVEAALGRHPRVEACAVRLVEQDRPARGAGEAAAHCSRCGLPSNYPGAELDAAGVCSPCRGFDRYRGEVARYFKTPAELQAILDGAGHKAGSAYDCLVLLSGGKDSTYVLCRLVDLGYEVLAFTLDNGYLSEQAKANIGRVVATLGVDHRYGSTSDMNRIFADSLERHANVCNGCFKTIYTLSMQLARDERIPYIVTGLTRGQFFETRLTEELFTDPELDADRIDDVVLDARKAYHRVDDAVRRLLDVRLFDTDRIFAEVRFVDFYRYVPVALDEMLAYLDERVPWIRPTDTGRSSNCLINDVGIYVHKRERGYHSYALPYSWDVRMGHKTRAAALAELDDDIDEQRVQRILDEVGYVPRAAGEERLVAFYTAAEELPASELRAHVKAVLPAYLVPAQFVRLESLPLAASGKVDRAALVVPSGERPASGTPFLAPRDDVERELARHWALVLGVERVGVRDNFFDLGGDSILAIRIVARCHRAGLKLEPGQLFEALTIEQLAPRCSWSAARQPAPVAASGPVALTPPQAWLLEQGPTTARTWHQVVVTEVPADADAAGLKKALAGLVARHDALRMRFTDTAGEWRAACDETAPAPAVEVVELGDAAEPERRERLDAAVAELGAGLALERPPLLAAALFVVAGKAEQLALVAHHLVVDAVSWSTLLADLTEAYRGVRRGEPVPAAGAATTLARWSQALAAYAGADAVQADLRFWRETLTRPAGAIPPEVTSDGADTVAAAAAVRVRLDEESTGALLTRVPKAGRIRVHELLLAALGLTLAEWAGERAVRLFVEGHGREMTVPGLDPSRTVGWLASLYPVVLELSAADDPAQVLRSTKEQLRAVPGRGFGYGLLRYLHPDPKVRSELAGLERPDVLFNYLGRADLAAMPDDGFRACRPLQLVRGDDATRRFGHEINALVTGGRLQLEWCFSRRRHRRATVERHAGRCLEHVRTLIEHGLGGGGVGAVDFPHARLDDAKLGKLAAVLRSTGKS